MSHINICPACLEPCNIVTMDFGIGAYEYWGAKGVDRQIATVTDCCEVTPKRDVWDSKYVDECHLNGGSVTCPKCPACVDYDCVDALPFDRCNLEGCNEYAEPNESYCEECLKVLRCED